MISESAFTVRGHGVHTSFLEMTHALQARDDVDIVVNSFRRGADVTHIHTVGLYALAHLLFGSGKKVVSVHVVPESFVGSLIGAERWLSYAKRYLSFFYGQADLLLAVSQSTEQILRDELGVQKPSMVLHNTVDIQQYATTHKDKLAARKKLKIDADRFVVVGSGQIQPRKRFDVFCKIAKEMPEAYFIWVGGIPFKQLGAEHKHMQELIDTAPPNLLVTGVIELADVKNYLQASDAMFMPSEQETFGLAIIEAAACGLPVVVRDIPDYDCTFGDKVVRGNDKTFKNLLTRLKQDKDLYQQVQKSSKELAERFDSHAGTDRLVEMYLSEGPEPALGTH